MVGAPARGQALDADAMAARELARIALMDLRVRDSLEVADHAIAGALLAVAQEHAAADAELLRWRIENASAAGDRGAVLTLTRRLLELDPHDTVAQLRYLSASLDRVQTAEGRLRSADRLAENHAIDPAVRSRVALDAALLARELGDDEGFARRLELALTLDGSNRDAADLALAFLGPQARGPVERAELLLQVLYADPSDAGTHRALALTMVEGGAFAAARRFYDLASFLARAEAGVAPPEVVSESFILNWYVKGVKPTLDELNAELANQRLAAQRAWDAAVAQGVPTTGMQKPDEIFLQLSFERDRLVGALMIDDFATAQAATDDIIRQLQLYARRFEDPNTRPPGLTTEDLTRRLATTAADIWGFLAWTSAAPEDIRAQMELLTSMLGADDAGVRRLAGFRHLKLGESDAALAIFEGLSGLTGELLDDIGYALALGAVGRESESAAMLLRVFQDGPLTGVGAWARQRLITVGQPDPIDAAMTAPLTAQANAVPGWLDTMLARPDTAMNLTADVVDTAPEALAPPRVVLTLRNIAPIPLALGADRYLSSMMAATPRLLVGTREEIELGQPETVNLARRLRLEPGQAVTVTIDAGAGATGWTIDAGASRTVRARWRVLQDFNVGARGFLVRGPMALEATTASVQWAPLEETTIGPDAMASAVASAEGVALARLAAAMRARAIESSRAPGEAWTTTDFERVAQAFAQRYPSCSPRDRLLLLAILPHARMFGPMAVVDAVARDEPDATLAAVVAATRVTDANDALLARWIDGGQEPAASVCALVRERLAAPSPRGYALAGPGIAGLVPSRQSGAR